MGLDVHFDRSGSRALLDILTTGPASELVELARNLKRSNPIYDLQLRRDTKGGNPRTWATLYYGMTALINLYERNGKYALTAHKSYMANGSFNDAWTKWHECSDLEAAWPVVSAYLRAIKDHVAPSAISKEGLVHAAISSGASDAYRIINRETSPGFSDKATKTRLLASWVAPFNAALDSRDAPPTWWPKGVKVGSSLDFLGVDIGGRLALIEAKADTASAAELAKVAVQVGVYAEMFAFLMRHDPGAVSAIACMLRQRAELGLSRKGVLHLRDERRVVPVVAIGPGRPSKEVHSRMWEVARSIRTAHGPNVDPIEVWYLDSSGRIREVERAEDVFRSALG